MRVLYGGAVERVVVVAMTQSGWQHRGHQALRDFAPANVFILVATEKADDGDDGDKGDVDNSNNGQYDDLDRLYLLMGLGENCSFGCVATSLKAAQGIIGHVTLRLVELAFH